MSAKERNLASASRRNLAVGKWAENQELFAALPTREFRCRADKFFFTGKRASQFIDSLYRSRKFLTPEAYLHLYKSTIRPIMEYCCHLWSGAPKSHLSFLDRVQHRMKNLVGSALYNTLQPLCQRRDVASLSLFYRYYFGRFPIASTHRCFQTL